MATLGDPLTDIGAAAGLPGAGADGARATPWPTRPSRPASPTRPRSSTPTPQRSGRDLSDLGFYLGLAVVQARGHLRGHLLPLHPGPDRRCRLRGSRRRARAAHPGWPRPRSKEDYLMEFGFDDDTPQSCGQRCWPSWTSTSTRPSRCSPSSWPQLTDHWAWTRRPILAELQAEAQAARAVEPVPAGRARGRPDQPPVRAAGRDHWPQPEPGAPPRSTARRPTPGTWRCWPQFGTEEQQQDSGWSRCWTARSGRAFAMTEPDVASSDATNIATRIVRDGDDYVINGRKWCITGAMNPDAQDLHRDGQDRPGRGPAPPAVDDPGARATHRA